MSNVLNARYNVTWEFCAGVARALDVPAVDVFRLAGLLPAGAGRETLRPLLDVAALLSADDLELLTRFATFLYQDRREKRDRR